MHKGGVAVSGDRDLLDDYMMYKMCCEDKDGTSEGCYIATAVYGTYDCPELWVLRRFRDERLRASAAGRLAVRVYYAASPRLVKRFGGSGRARAFSKTLLDRFVVWLKKKGLSDRPYIGR